ncbi:hypothetical protein ATO6_00615 [Oceanicola sp. 22II-s10i]|uniref:hypothetical protein n=1 Tax=Oceanicola sp. 22II-s10i TaxID=1317116 RepID=UPI000B5244E1|nr:hypothetical protein [Oceanicola sp. 22II-s10i]OWU85490.1 hypothetical protein ATO6_00615 [Oceanicola sp. 22II-s10i]
MTHTSQITRFAPATAAVDTRKTPLWLRLLNRLANADRRYREERRLREMTADRLDDLSIPRETREHYRRQAIIARDKISPPIRMIL